MNAIVKAPVEPIVRTQLNFKLDEVPRFWFGGDPFRTSKFDERSLTFTDRERYFIESVRLIHDQIINIEIWKRDTSLIKKKKKKVVDN